MEQAVLSIPHVRAAEAGRFLYEYMEPGTPHAVQVEIRTNHAESDGLISLAFDQEKGEPILLAAHTIAFTLAEVLPLEPVVPDENLGEQGFNSQLEQPTVAQAIPQGPALRSVVSSRMHLPASRMGESNPTEVLTKALVGIIIPVLLLLAYLGPHPLRGLLIGLLGLIEVIVVIRSWGRRRKLQGES